MVKKGVTVKAPAGEANFEGIPPCIEVTRNYQKTIAKYVHYGYFLQIIIISIELIGLCIDFSIIGIIILISTILLGAVSRKTDMKSKILVKEVEKSC